MATYDSNHVKNIALLGHAGSGKTTMAECMVLKPALPAAAVLLLQKIQ